MQQYCPQTQAIGLICACGKLLHRVDSHRAQCQPHQQVCGLGHLVQQHFGSPAMTMSHNSCVYCLQGVILYGEPGTGKTLLAKAVANSTSATFLRVVGSELIQKYLGDGPKLVRELFRVADEMSPSIVFIGEWLASCALALSCPGL